MSEYDLMRKADEIEEDADLMDTEENLTDKEKYFDYYDDIKTNIKQDW